MKKTIITILILFLINILIYSKGILLKELQNPTYIGVTGKTIFIKDGFKVLLYDLDSLKFKSSFGKKGGGPGEFPYHFDMSVGYDKAYCYSYGKIIIISSDGKMVKEKKFNEFIYTLIPFNKKIVTSGSLIRKDGAYSAVNLLDSDFKLIKTLKKKKIKGRGKLSLKLFPTGSKVGASDTKIVIGTRDNNPTFTFYDSKGEFIKTIPYKYKKIEVSKAYIKNKNAEIKRSKNRGPLKGKNVSVEIPDLFPPYANFFCIGDLIYIIKYLPNPNNRELEIIDLEGKVLKSQIIPYCKYRFYYIYNNNYYYLTEDEDKEEWNLNILPLK